MTQPVFTSLSGFPTSPDSGFIYWTAGFTMTWSVYAPNGVCHQNYTDQDYNDLGGDTDPVLGYSTYTVPIANSARSYANTDGDAMDFGRGGYNAIDRITECNGAKITSNPVHTVIDIGNDADTGNGETVPTYYSPGTVSAWRTANCTCFFDGTSTYTSVKNASFSFLTPQPLDATGVRVALLMPKGPGRGSAAVYVDNVRKATVNTYAATNTNGKITYQILLPGTHTHVVRVVNLATAGHPRIDIDAFIN